MQLPIRRGGDDPSREFERLRSPFAAQLERWQDFLAPVHSLIDAAAPRTDLEETDDSYVLEVELPGVSRHDIDLQVEESRLVLTAQRVERERVGLLRHRNRTTGRTALAVTLPSDIDTEHVTADLKHGVLTVVIPKGPHSRPRHIPITQRATR